jgi:hypothetical protein
MNFDDTARFFGPSDRMHPELFIAPQHVAKRMCQKCKKREVRPRQKYCEGCAKSRKRDKTRLAMRKRRCEVRKLANSPAGTEALTTPENQVCYNDPKTSFSPSSFLTGEGVKTAGGVA